MTKALVFVYGTLKSGGPLNRVMQEAGGVSQGVALLEESEFVLVAGHMYPYAVPVPPSERERLRRAGISNVIRGELFELPETCVARLDRTEGYPSHYNRSVVMVRIGRDFDQEHNAFIYHRNDPLRDGDSICADGEWWPRVHTVKYSTAKPAKQPR